MKYLYFLSFIMLIQTSYAQYDQVLDLLYYRKFEEANKIITEDFDGYDEKLLTAMTACEKNDLATSFKILFEIDTLQLNDYQKAFYYKFLAHTYDNNVERGLSLKNFSIAQKKLKKLNLEDFYNEINLYIYFIYDSNKPFKEKAPAVLQEMYENAVENDNKRQTIQALIELGFNEYFKGNEAGFFEKFDEAFAIANKTKDVMDLAKLHSFYGIIYGEYIGDYDKAEFHYEKSYELYSQVSDKYKGKPLLLSQSYIYAYQEDFNTAIQYLLRADKEPDTELNLNVNEYIYKELANNYEEIGKTDSALYYTKKYVKLRNEINEKQQFINITRFEAEKKEKENTILIQENQRNTILLIFFGVVLLALLVVGYLIYANSKRKQVLLTKERELAEQKNKSLLKEQELKSIDAMLEGQEKERQRLASDLHDNIGSSLTSVKMHFNKIKQQLKDKTYDENLFEKTDNLLAETYQEIRNLAHIKNAGVLAKDGLVPALNKLIDKSSNPPSFIIELNIFDLDKRLKNALEIGIFRIIQELITNAIKHAKASKLSIAITNHGDLINIIVEDNGVGFNVQDNINEGLGIESIQKRVKHLSGEIEIESTANKGTTVLIDLPL